MSSFSPPKDVKQWWIDGCCSRGTMKANRHCETHVSSDGANLQVHGEFVHCVCGHKLMQSIVLDPEDLEEGTGSS